MCTVAGRDVLLPIILFIDKTVTDLHGNLSLEPVSFRLGTFTRQLRNQARAWHPLGYVQNQSLHPSEGGLGVSIDYHIMLKEIFKSFSEVQSMKGVKLDLFYRGKVHHVVIYYLPKTQLDKSGRPAHFFNNSGRNTITQDAKISII
jgi:hypothetical protein